ncbi:MAG: TolC family protein, partial [Planctomycetota bacterium]
MSRPFLTLRVVLVGALVATIGCAPQQPFYFFEDGDLSHYIETATEVEFPDVENPTLDDVTGAIPPLTLDNPEPTEVWELALEEAVKIALDNSKVIRSLYGPIPQLVDRLQTNPDFPAVSTVYDPALRETDPRFGVAAALAAFDTQLTTSASWEKNDTIRNPFVFLGSTTAFPSLARQDTGTFQAQLRKTAATGGTWTLRHNVFYDYQPDVARLFTSDWSTNVEAEFRQPLLQGNGVQFNRIAGPGSIPGYNYGVMIARVNTDISLTEFEGQVRNLVNDVERAYWELHFAYHQLDAHLEARERALAVW